MLALWPEVKRVTGQNLIFEGTENLPAQQPAARSEKAVDSTLSEQYTSGFTGAAGARAGRLFCQREVVPSGRDVGANGALDDRTTQLTIMPVWRWPCRGWKTNI
ncbi:hypothetical protein KCP74_13880 [Salmonella enterica subsp. enterica]|nr:hypothetical protein KCP74_13880 [Salmonella enterica subsp. enterica]